MAEKDGPVVNKSGKKVEKEGKVEKVYVTFDNSIEEVVELNKDRGKRLIFDHTEFLELPEEIVEELSHENARNYFISLGIVKQKELQRKRRDREKEKVTLTDPLKDVDDSKMAIRKRRGWHQAWKRDDEFPYYEQIGYRVVREPTEEQIKEGYEVGYEKGEIKTIGYKDKAELIAMECPQELFDKHREYVETMSKGSKKRRKEEAREKIERAGVNFVDDEVDEESAALEPDYERMLREK